MLSVVGNPALEATAEEVNKKTASGSSTIYETKELENAWMVGVSFVFSAYLVADALDSSCLRYSNLNVPIRPASSPGAIPDEEKSRR